MKNISFTHFMNKSFIFRKKVSFLNLFIIKQTITFDKPKSKKKLK